MNLIFLGPPGAGKGTQAKRFEDAFGLKQLSTGDMLRAAAAEGTKIGREAKSHMDKGKLVPDEVVTGAVAERIAKLDCANGVIFDGFPRNVAQAEALDRLLKSMKRKLDAVIELKVDEKALLARVEKRAAETRAAGQTIRPDDNPETLKTRLEVYRKETAPLIDHYRHKGNLLTVDGMTSIDEVSKAIEAKLAPVLKASGKQPKWLTR